MFWLNSGSMVKDNIAYRHVKELASEIYQIPPYQVVNRILV